MSASLTCALALALVASGSLRAQVVEVNLTAAPGTTQVAPGVSVNAWLYNGSMPGPTLRVTEGQTLRVRFQNNLPDSTAIHWHGQPIQLGMDGVPDISRPAIAAGQEFIYDLSNLIPGTYWFHPHGHEMQLDVGLASVLIVDPANPGSDPAFDVEQTIVLDDWTNPLGGAFSGHLLNGRSSAGQNPVSVQLGQRLRLRVVNVAATTNYVFALDGHAMTVTHADGNRVQPVVVQAIPIGIGERWDVLVDCNNPGTWSLAASTIENRNATVVRAVVQYAGQTGPMPAATFVPTNLASGSLLNYSQLASYFPVQPITPTPNRTFTASLGMGMGPSGMIHTINGQTWPNVTPFQVAAGEQVQMSIVNNGMMMPEYHPMHVHGHFFRLMGTAGGTANPPKKDTVLIRPNGQPGSSATVQISMDNPGRWLLHCHNMEHMATGMMTAIEYLGDADGDGVLTRSDYEPMLPLPVVTISDQPSAFAPGASGTVRVQWTPGQAFGLFIGPNELAPWVSLPGLGTLVLDPTSAALYGFVLTSTSGVATLPYILPNNPAIIGLRVGMQGVGVVPPANSLVLSTFQALTAR
ncbi:MAG: multicopper oxidase family protein [Planctomycetes bacterium]|nr:multicopper oxidase family protein [Planctomycetota bacterium]